MDLNNIWNSFLEKIKLQISDIAYDTWFSETKLINLNKIREDTQCYHLKQLTN